jgi:hypothetical protein
VRHLRPELGRLDWFIFRLALKYLGYLGVSKESWFGLGGPKRKGRLTTAKEVSRNDGKDSLSAGHGYWQVFNDFSSNSIQHISNLGLMSGDSVIFKR